MYQLATAPRGIGQVLDSVFKLARLAWMRMLPYALLTVVLSLLPSIYILTTGVLDDPAKMLQVFFSPTYWILVLVMLPVSWCIYGAAIARMESIAQGADIGFGASVRVALPKILSLFVASICFFLVIAIGLVLLIVPGVILIGSLFLFLPAIVLDGKGPVESLNYSHKLVWGNWWRVATIGTIAVIISYVLYLVFSFVVGLAIGFGATTDPTTSFVLSIVSSGLGLLLLTSFYQAVFVEIYREVKMRKTGGDLAARIASVGTAR